MGILAKYLTTPTSTIKKVGKIKTIVQRVLKHIKLLLYL